MSSLLLQQACVKLSAHIEATKASEPGQIRLNLDGGFVQVFFRNGRQYAKHTVDVEEKNGKIAINTWVVAEGNFGFHLDTIEITNPGDFVEAILDLRDKVTPEAVNEAYQKRYN
jgi:hypothetical protein